VPKEQLRKFTRDYDVNPVVVSGATVARPSRK
jgi:hypothetical protein